MPEITITVPEQLAERLTAQLNRAPSHISTPEEYIVRALVEKVERAEALQKVAVMAIERVNQREKGSNW